jgi:hypothetical protein
MSRHEMIARNRESEGSVFPNVYTCRVPPHSPKEERTAFPSRVLEESAEHEMVEEGTITWQL